MGEPLRGRAVGREAVDAALATGGVAVVLVRRDDDALDALAERAKQAGARVRRVSVNVLRRFTPGDSPADALAMIGAAPRASLAELLARRGDVWLLAGARYPGNVGFAIRTAEVAGAAGVIADAALAPSARRAALRASMRADWLLPVLFEEPSAAVQSARDAGRQVLVLEDAGEECALESLGAAPRLFVVGAERDGVPREIVDAADVVLRLPTAGFIPSYNVHAAMAAVALQSLASSSLDSKPTTHSRRSGST